MSTPLTTKVSRGVAALALVAVPAVLGACGGPEWDASDATITPVGESTLLPVEGVVLDDATKGELQQILEATFAESGMPGVAAYVRIGDDEWTSSLGVGDLATEEPFDPDGIVRIASNTKTFVATAVLELVDEGEVSLDDTVDQYVDGITDGDRITVRDLLHMSSGVWDFTSDEELIGRWDADPTMEWTSEETIDLIKGKPAQFAPGEKVVYTDSNYVLLGAIVEEVTGEDVATVVNRDVVDAVGLSDTRFPTADEADIPSPHQTGYKPTGATLGDLDDLVPVTDINPEVAWTAGNMTSTLADMAVWAEALADGRLLSPGLQQERLEFERFDGQTLDIGYGLGLIRLNDFVGHDGAIIGHSSVAMRYPGADATFVIVGNGSNNFTTPTMEIFLTMVQRLYPDQLS